ncbi:HmuY family protein [Pedobacter sp. MW01-1-1]|uniref:HmuY family protein n=1 Tax=Pedobacter sp. MW01-1-1 TaxID=3383027 RepID=UPI003FF07CAD
MNKLNSILALALVALSFTACQKEGEDPIIVVPPSDGSTLTLNGIAATEEGAAAANSVYVDFSTDKQTPALRDSWDLGFYSGNDFKVIINATNGASALMVNKTDLNTVTAADFDPNALKIGQGGGTFALMDDPREANILNKTVIATISATDADNKVYIINRKGGTNTVLANEELYKIRILRKGTGYTLQYAKVTETTFKTLDITKNTDTNFQFASLVKGSTVSVEPTKASWDLVWGYSLYYTATIPYAFSDLIFINNLAGVTAVKVSTSTKAYADFAEGDIAALTFSNARDVIGSSWRATTGAAIGVNTTVFYVIKDGVGNVYKLKFVSFINADGGTRGKPVIEYKLIKKG